MPQSDERLHEFIDRSYVPRNFKASLKATSLLTPDSYCLQVNDSENCGHSKLIPLVDK